jgi:hypothetical protein
MPQNVLDEQAIVIQSPCTVPWESMQGDRVKRFCGQCRLHVHDVSEMSRRDVRELLTSTGGNCCLRVWRRPDGRVITQDCNRVLRAIRRRVAAVRAAAAGVLALVGLGGCHRGSSPPEAPPSRPTTGAMVAPPAPPPTMGTPATLPQPPPVKGATVTTGR